MQTSIELLGARDLPAFRRAGRAAAETLALVGRRIAPGVRTVEIDQWVRAETGRQGEYAELREKIKEQRKARIGKQGDPKASARALLKVVDAKEPPLRVFFGAAPLGIAKADYARRLEEWEKWQPVALEAQGD